MSSDNENTSFNRLNWINLAAYVLNTGVTYGIGVGGLFNLPSNAELSEKYQTLVTPAGFAFAIWGPIFLFQFLWVVHQLAAKKQRNSPWVIAVGYNYLWVCLAQVGWTFAFSNELITLSVIMMLTIWFFLGVLVRAIYKYSASASTNSLSVKQYVLWFLPFTMHFGWITVASVANINLDLVASNTSTTIQYNTAIFSLIVLVAGALFLLRYDYVIPLVVSWALWGVYNELANPQQLIVNSFSEEQIKFVQRSDAVALGVLLLCVPAKWVWKKISDKSESKNEENALLSPENMIAS